MPNRILKESICTSENVDQLSAFEETVFYRLIVNCDDYGRMDGRPKILISKLFPLKEVRVKQMEDALRALTSAELVTLYTVDGKPFLQMKTWDKHQQMRAKRSKYPAPDDGMIASDINCNQMISSDIKCSRNPIQSESETESESESKQKGASPPRRSVPPTVEDVETYCREHGYHIDAEAFVDYYATRGWRLSTGQKVADWTACIRTWVRKDRERNGGTAAAEDPHGEDYYARLRGAMKRRDEDESFGSL